MYAYNDNEKSLNPEDNGMVKALDAEKPKTALIAPKKEEKPSKPKEVDKEEKAADKSEDGKKKEKSSKKAADKPEESDTEKKKPEELPKKESFWKPRPAADKASEERTRSKSQEGQGATRRKRHGKGGAGLSGSWHQARRAAGTGHKQQWQSVVQAASHLGR